MPTTADQVLAYLESFGLKKEGPGKYRSNSPLRPGSDSHSFALILDMNKEPAGEYGAYNDFVSGEKGSLYDLAEKLGIEVPRREVPSSKRPYSDLDDYAQAHGIAPDTLRAWAWSETTYQDRPALAFKTATGIRYRFLDNEKPPYKSPPGYEACWYGLERAVKLATDACTPLVLCNGEISTVSGQVHGVPACAITGSSEKALPVSLLEKLLKAWPGQPILIALDCDKKGRSAARKLKAQLTNKGIDVRALDLGLTDGGDLADFCRLHEQDSWSELIALPDLAEDGSATPPPDDGVLHYTDLGNARRLVSAYGNVLRYCYGWGKWLIWDGGRWKMDDCGKIDRAAKNTVAAMYAEAAQMEDDKARRALVGHAMHTEGAARIRNMIDLARSEPDIPVQVDELDVDGWLLNVKNGCLDLLTGKLLPHNPIHYQTKQVDVEFEPDAYSARWESFLTTITDGDPELIAFLQRAIGYSLTGDTSEQCIFFMYGTGANGKTTFIETIRALLGDYAQQTPTETLMRHDNDAINNDVARLRGARFIAATETEERQRLAEVLVKQLTGGDKIAARFLHQEFFEFRPVGKFWLAGNHKPAIRGTDYAIWRRIKLVPFAITIPPEKRDPGLLTKLCDDLPGILNWAVEGCKLWREQGLDTPRPVIEATENYRDEQDLIRAFLDDCIFKSPNVTVKAGDIYSRYQGWCASAGERCETQNKFGSRLTELGFERYRSNGHRLWKGLAIKAEETENEE